MSLKDIVRKCWVLLREDLQAKPPALAPMATAMAWLLVSRPKRWRKRWTRLTPRSTEASLKKWAASTLMTLTSWRCLAPHGHLCSNCGERSRRASFRSNSCASCVLFQRVQEGVLEIRFAHRIGTSGSLDERAEGLQPIGEDLSVVSVLFTAAETARLLVKTLALDHLTH